MRCEGDVKIVEVGDKITALGHTYTVAKILMQEYFPGRGKVPEWWNVEFLDRNDDYHHWKNQFDGGCVIPKS